MQLVRFCFANVSGLVLDISSTTIAFFLFCTNFIRDTKTGLSSVLKKENFLAAKLFLFLLEKNFMQIGLGKKRVENPHIIWFLKMILPKEISQVLSFDPLSSSSSSSSRREHLSLLLLRRRLRFPSQYISFKLLSPTWAHRCWGHFKIHPLILYKHS